MGDELGPDLDQLLALLRGTGDRVEELVRLRKSAPSPTESSTRYFRRSTAPEGAGGRIWDKAVVDLAKQGKVFKPGREHLIKCEDYFAWIEAHPFVSRPTKPRPEQAASEVDDAPIPFDRARNLARADRARARAREAGRAR